jgi:hypothetical protein
MRRDIEPNERAYSSKEVAEEVGIATPTVRKYGQILERNGYEFLKDGERRIFVQSDIESLIALRDTDKPLDDTAKALVEQQNERLEGSNKGTRAVSLPDTYENLPHDPNQLKEAFMFLANELAATREMNVQMTNEMSQIQTKVSRLQQEHHIISSSIANSAQKTNTKIEKLTEQQTSHYETLLQEERQKSESLQKEIQSIREEQRKEWRSQNEFNKRLEQSIQKPTDIWGGILSLFRK